MGLIGFLGVIAQGVGPWAQVDTPQYDLAVPMLSSQPVIDGRIDDGEWQGAVSPFGWRALRTGRMHQPQPFVLLARDEQALYLAARLPLPEGATPKRSVAEHDGELWTDDAIELFVDPHPGDDRYFQFIVSAGGATWESLGRDSTYSAEWDAATDMGDEEWTAELRVPFSALGVAAPADGDVWALNVGWDRQTPTNAILTWAPVSSGFHESQAFRKLSFSNAACPFAISEVSDPQDGRLEIAGTCDVSPGRRAQARLYVYRTGAGERTEVASASADMTPGAGRALALRTELPIVKGIPAPGEYEARFLLTATDEGAQPTICADLTVPFNVAPELEFALRRYFLTEGKVVVGVTAPGLRLPRDEASLRVQLVADSGDVIAEESVECPPEGRYVDVEFDVTDVAPGDYEIRAAAIDESGAEAAAVTQTLQRPEKPEWLGSTEGISDEVLPPWTPVRAKGREVNVWGRTYEFDGLPLPTAITTREASILAEPLRFAARANGSAQEWRRRKTTVSERKPAAAVLTTSASSDDLRISATVRAEYDGMIRSDFTIEPRGEVTLESLQLEIPLKREHAKYLYHFPGRWRSAYNAGALPRDGFTSAFRPFVWLGDEDRGLAWFSESEQGFAPIGADDVITISREGDQVVLRVRVIGEPRELSEPLEYTFGMQATPVKPLTEDVWDMRICHQGAFGIEERITRTAAWLDYPAEGNIDLAQGTFEAWVRPQFDTDPPVAQGEPGRGIYNRDLMTVEFADGDRLGFYWNIDDRGMRIYTREGQANPLVVGSRCDWKQGEWHHVAVTWGDEARIYLDGRSLASLPYQGTLRHSLEGAKIRLGGGVSEFDVDEIRISDIARASFDLTEPPEADEHTLLLDRFDEEFEPDGRRPTTPVKGSPGRPSATSRFIDGKFGQALSLYEPGPPKTMLDRLAELGVRTICFHEHWTDIQNYTSTTHGEKLRALVAACHERGIRLLLYFGYEISNIAPEWELYSDECLVFPRGGGYHRQPEQRAYIVCYGSAWQDFMAHGIAEMIDEYDIDGVYLDGTANPWACRNVHHGCGYERPDGSIGQTYQFFDAREMMRRIYAIVKTRKPDGLVNVHQSTCMTIPTLAWATSYWDGEQFGSIDAGPWALGVLPLDTFRCEFMGRQWGVPAEMLCYDRPYTYRQAMSFTLLHDVLVRGRLGGGLELEARLWEAMEDFGRKQARFIPYWERSGCVRTNDPSVKVSAYSRREKGVMLVISNLGRERTQVRVELDREKLGLSAGARLTAEDVVDEVTLLLDDDALSFGLDSLDFKVVQVAPER